MADDKNNLPADEIAEIKSAALQMAPPTSQLDTLYQRYEEIYFMTAADQRQRITNVDEKDVKTTISPSGRNAVTGMKRLLDTAEVRVTIKSNGDKHPASDRIEKGLLQILAQSGMYRRARIEKDLNLSAVLYGPTILASESVDDLIAQQKKSGKKMYVQHLEKIRKYTPFLLRAINPRQSSSRWGEFGMIAHLRKYDLTGDVVQERWGIPDLSRITKYRVWDWLDPENRVAWIEGNDAPLLAKKHLLPSMNIVARFAGGSSLFDEAERQMQGFLYAHVKGEWDRRENLFWTYLFTAMFMQGLPGPLVMIDKDSTPNDKVEINFTGGVRTIFGKGQVVDYPVIDGDVLRIKELMDGVNAESTIHRQTLGQNIQGSTFSGLAMLSSAGQLPLEDPKESLCMVYRDQFDHILCRIKEEGIENDLIPADLIPDDYEVYVTMKPKLPQDNLRNAQIATTLAGKVSDEWLLEEVLQIDDPKAMMKQARKEQLLNMLFSSLPQTPYMQEILKRVMGGMTGQPAQVGAGDQAPPAQPSPEEMAMMEQQGQGQPTPEQMAMMQQGGGMEGMPQTGPMIPPQERM